MSDDLTQRILHGVAITTAHLGRDSKTGSGDRVALAAALGDQPSADDFIQALADVLLVTEILLVMHASTIQQSPLEVLQQIASHNAGR